MAGVFDAGFAGAVGAARDGGLDHDVLADAEGVDVGADLFDYARELVAQGYGDGFFGYGMGGYGAEGGTAEVFVKVGAADAYEGWGDLGDLEEVSGLNG